MPFFSITSPTSGNATQLQGRPIAATAPATGTVLTYSGSAWVGSQGVTGPTGAQGADGPAIYSGSGAPSNALGVSGDFYIDTGSSYLYGPKASGTWPAGISIDGGPTGPTGVAGPTGPSGGPTGPTGPGPRTSANVQTLSATKNIALGDERYQFLCAGGASRDVVLPTGADAGLDFVIAAADDQNYAINIKTTTATGVITLNGAYGPFEAICVFDGTNWRALYFSG